LTDENGGKKKNNFYHFRITSEKGKHFKSLKMSDGSAGKNQSFCFRVEDETEAREWKLALR
jgi:hypothetical protein